MLELLINGQPPGATSISEWQEVEFQCLPPPGATLALTVGVAASPLQPFLHPDDPTWRWRWNPQNAVGQFPLRLQATWPNGQTEEVRSVLAVLPRKLDQRHYDLLLADLQHTAYALVYALTGGTAGATAQRAEEWKRSLLADYFSLFGERFATLERAVLRIARQPHTQLHAGSARVEPGQARDFSRLDTDLSQDLPAAPPLATEADPGRPPLPAAIAEPRSRPTTDTYENRLLKRLLHELYQRARQISDLAGREAATSRAGATRPAGAALREIADQSRAVTRRLQELRALPFLAEVGSLTSFHGPSQVMQRNPAYRQVYRFWQDLRRHPFLVVESPLFQIPLHELPYLYECWCAVQLVATLLELPDVRIEAQSLVSGPDAPGSAAPASRTTSSSLYQLTLTEEQPLLLLAWRGMSLQLRYQPRYRPTSARRMQHVAAELISLDRHTRIPDFVLELEQPDGAPAIAVLDAKYRLDASGGVPEDALADAYSYLGSIGTPAGERVARAAMLLYPGTGSAEQYASGVGAIPLLPGATAALQTWLEQLWSDDPA
jgi:large subunit ribosomal protein MRP49